MPLAEPSLAPLRGGVHDLDQHVVGMNLANAAFDLAVIEEDRLARLRRGKSFGKRAGDVRNIARDVG